MIKLSTEVICRIAQILQEALIGGVDISDVMRLMELEVHDDGKLYLTEEYKKNVAAGHQRALDKVEKLKAELDALNNKKDILS